MSPANIDALARRADRRRRCRDPWFDLRRHRRRGVDNPPRETPGGPPARLDGRALRRARDANRQPPAARRAAVASHADCRARDAGRADHVNSVRDVGRDRAERAVVGDNRGSHLSGRRPVARDSCEPKLVCGAPPRALACTRILNSRRCRACRNTRRRSSLHSRFDCWPLQNSTCQ